MGQFSVKIYASPGSSLSANQHLERFAERVPYENQPDEVPE
jgi:hypothetical protein